MSKRDQIDKLTTDQDFIDSFMSKIKIKKNDCWEWQGGLDPGGYGRIHVKRHCEHKRGRNFFAHRISYMIHRGYITPDEYILHQCHNRLCCNPEHHKIGDHMDNMDDLHDSRRIAGENNPRSKVREEEVEDILELYWEELYSVSKIKELYSELDLKTGTITDIIYGRTWTDVYNDFFEVDE